MHDHARTCEVAKQYASCHSQVTGAGDDTRRNVQSAFAKTFANDSKATMSGVTLEAKTESAIGSGGVGTIKNPTLVRLHQRPAPRHREPHGQVVQWMYHGPTKALYTKAQLPHKYANR